MPCQYSTSPPDQVFTADSLRLEAVTVCVGFDDMLDMTIAENHAHVDTMIVVTAHDDRKTQAVCSKHGAICVPTDLMYKNGRRFNKGAAINAGFSRFQYYGWRLHLDADILLPDSCRRVLFNHSDLHRDCLYGADRVNVLPAQLARIARRLPQHRHGLLVETQVPTPAAARYVSTLEGYLPLGYFQLWHASCQKPYPYSLGSAAHDDCDFSALWPARCRRLLPTIQVYHLCSRQPTWGENWEGMRHQPRWPQ